VAFILQIQILVIAGVVLVLSLSFAQLGDIIKFASCQLYYLYFSLTLPLPSLRSGWQQNPLGVLPKGILHDSLEIEFIYRVFELDANYYKKGCDDFENFNNRILPSARLARASGPWPIAPFPPNCNV